MLHLSSSFFWEHFWLMLSWVTIEPGDILLRSLYVGSYVKYKQRGIIRNTPLKIIIHTGHRHSLLNLFFTHNTWRKNILVWLSQHNISEITRTNIQTACLWTKIYSIRTSWSLHCECNSMQQYYIYWYNKNNKPNASARNQHIQCLQSSLFSFHYNICSAMTITTFFDVQTN